MWSMTQEKLVFSIYHLQIIKDALLVYLTVAVNRKKMEGNQKNKKSQQPTTHTSKERCVVDRE